MPLPTFSADPGGRKKSCAIQRAFGHHCQRKQRLRYIKNKDLKLTNYSKITVFQKTIIHVFSSLHLSVCSSSCLWNHNRFWQICPNSHSCQQAQVKTIFYYLFSLLMFNLLSANKPFLCADWWPRPSCSTGNCRKIWCGHTPQVIQLSVKLTLKSRHF